MVENKIIVLDFGSQYTHLIARRIRELHIFSEVMLPDAPLSELEKAKGIILSGSPYSICDEDTPKYNKKLFSLKKPILGICYGHQLLARELGGEVGSSGSRSEFGTAKMSVVGGNLLFEGLDKEEVVWMSHHDRVTVLPEGFETVGFTDTCRNAAIYNAERKFYGLQFHPEVTHTPKGLHILRNFAVEICGCGQDWRMEKYLDEKVSEIRKVVGDRNVLILASGGVDSTVTLALMNKALPKERILALHVDNGFMRKNETSKVQKALEELNLSRLNIVDAKQEFYSALHGVIEPEQKRQTVGEMFIKVKDRELKKLNLKPEEWLLAQGTIYPDTIETAKTKYSNKIKTHHNRIALIMDLIDRGHLIEPIDELYKDEVRELGREIGLPEEIVRRHPFPGPGLAIRVLCAKKEKVDLSKVEEKAKKLLKGTDYIAKVLPVKSVGVQGDLRTYRHPVVVSGAFDWEKLEKISTNLANELKEINRVVFALHPAKIEKIELMEAELTEQRISTARNADAIVREVVEKHNLTEKIWQFPVVIVPVKVDGKGEAIILRPVESREAMTARFYPMYKEAVDEIVAELLKLENVNAIFYDITHKPPATIEWE